MKTFETFIFRFVPNFFTPESSHLMSASMESMEVIPSINVEELIAEAMKISQVN